MTDKQKDRQTNRQMYLLTVCASDKLSNEAQTKRSLRKSARMHFAAAFSRAARLLARCLLTMFQLDMHNLGR